MPGRLPRRGAALVSALALAGAISPASAGAAEPPRTFFGVESKELLGAPAAARREALAAKRPAGVEIVRQVFHWEGIEPEPGRYALEPYDELVADAAAQRIEIMPMLFGAPPFRSSRPPGGGDDGVYPPRRPSDMGAFAALLVRRYGPRGTLWAERPEVPRLPIRSWQIWNEPNLPYYWPPRTDPAAYVELLRAAGRGILSVDPGAEVVTAGLPNSNLGTPYLEYLDGMYRAGAAGTFDALAIHPYARDVDSLVSVLTRARELMSRHGDPAPIWATEFGWATGGPRDYRFTVGEEGQAARIAEAVDAFGRLRETLRLRGLVYYGWKDLRSDGGFWGDHTGLLDFEDRPKPGLIAFRDAIARLRRADPGRPPEGPSPASLSPASPTATARPAGRARVARRRLRVTADGRARVILRCPADGSSCHGVLRIERRHRRRYLPLGQRGYRLSSGRSATVAVRLTPATRRLLDRRGSIRVRVRLIGPGGPAVLATSTLKAPGARDSRGAPTAGDSRVEPTP